MAKKPTLISIPTPEELRKENEKTAKIMVRVPPYLHKYITRKYPNITALIVRLFH